MASKKELDGEAPAATAADGNPRATLAATGAAKVKGRRRSKKTRAIRQVIQ